MSAAAAPAQPVVSPPPPAPAVAPVVEGMPPAPASAAGSVAAPAAAAHPPVETPAPVMAEAPIEEPPLQANGVRVVPDSEWGKFKAAEQKRAAKKAQEAAEAAQVEAAKRWRELGFVSEDAAYQMMVALKGTGTAPATPAAEVGAPPAATAPVIAAAPAAPAPAAAVEMASIGDLAAARAEAAAAKLELEAVKAGFAQYPDWAVLQLEKHIRTLPADQQRAFNAKGFFEDLKTKNPTMATAPTPVREVPVTTTPGAPAPSPPSPAAVTNAVAKVDYSKLTREQQQQYDNELAQKARLAKARR